MRSNPLKMLFVLLLIPSICLISCGGGGGGGGGGENTPGDNNGDINTDPNLVYGVWLAHGDGERIEIALNEDGTYSWGDDECTDRGEFIIQNDQLIFESKQLESDGYPYCWPVPVQMFYPGSGRYDPVSFALNSDGSELKIGGGSPFYREALEDFEPTVEIEEPNRTITVTEGSSVEYFASISGGNLPYKIEWDFDGGATNAIGVVEENSIEKVMYTVGTFDVTVTVTDIDGDTDTASVEVIVEARPVDDGV